VLNIILKVFLLNPSDELTWSVLLGFSVYSADGVAEYPEVKRARHGKYLHHVNNRA